MENYEEKQSNDAEGKITTFASPVVLAAILDEQTLDQDIVDLNEQGQNSETVTDSLDVSLNDTQESTKLRENGELQGQTDTEELIDHENEQFKLTMSPTALGFTEEVPDFPKSSTPAENIGEEKRKNADKIAKPRKPQHIIDRNKEQVGKRVKPAKSSYAQMHAIKARNKLEKNTENKTKTQGDNTPSSSSENQLENVERVNNDLSQNSYFENHLGQIQHLNSTTMDLEEQDSDLLEGSYSSGAPFVYQNHGPYYDASQNSSLNYSTYESTTHPEMYTRGYQNATDHLTQSHAVMGPVPPLYFNNLCTQSAPPRVYGYQRKPLISSLHTGNLNEEDYFQSSVLPNNDFVTSGRSYKTLESSLHRKFSSDPYLAQSSSPSLQKIRNVGRSSKAGYGSYSSLRQPFQYQPYTLKDYQNFAGSKDKPLAGGLGPNVDTDDFKEKMKKVSKQREYTTMLRAQHSNMRKQHKRKGPASSPVKAHHVKEAEIKRQTALNYAKNVPKPKQMASRKHSESGRHGEENRGDEDQDITVLEILRMRHEQERKEVESIRKELASKIRL